ncbi:MAG: hypothetical protein JSS82_00295 [Bacteroidetes bacterium]|nr:hypothetical protein [Bacteroidota bacterium]
MAALTGTFRVNESTSILKTDVATEFTTMGQFIPSSMSMIRRRNDQEARYHDTSAKVANIGMTLTSQGVGLMDILDAGYTFQQFIDSGRTLDELVELGIDKETLITRMLFGTSWPQTDYSKITKLNIAFSDVLHKCHEGDMSRALKTKIPPEVFVLWKVTMRELMSFLGNDISKWMLLNYIPFSSLVKELKFSSSQFSRLFLTEDLMDAMNWTTEDINNAVFAS